MATKSFVRNFGEFKGLDLFSSSLSPETGFATIFKNVEMTARKALRKRPGWKRAGQKYGVGTTNYLPNMIGKYSGFSSDGITVVTELVGTSPTSFYRLTTGTCKIVGPANSTFSFYPNSTGRWIADCLVNGVSVGAGFPLDCGNIAGVLLVNLKNLIDSLGGGWSCTLTPYATADSAGAAQLGRDHANPVAVDAGHTISVASYYPFAPRIEVVNQAGSTLWADVIEVAGNNIRLKPSAPFDIDPGQMIGVGLYPVELLPVTEAVSCAGAELTLTFPYWQNVVVPSNYNPLDIDEGSSVFRNLSDCLFWPAQYDVAEVAGGILKYDGREVCNAGVSLSDLFVATAIAGGGLPLGRYKYLRELVRTDAAGNEIHGNASDLLGEVSATTNGANLQVRVANGNPYTATSLSMAGHHGAVISAGAAATNVLTVTAATNTLRLGDWVYFKDSATGVTQYRQVTGLTNTSVTVSGAAVTVSNAAPNQFISNIVGRFYRTKVGGNFYYYLDEWPLPFTLGSQNFTDNTADANLGELWEGPFLGTDRRDVPPNVRLIEEHQGLLVGISDPDEPNKLKWSNYESPEYWSASTNYQNVSTGDGGKFTALASDSLDTLVLFKESSFKVVSGDLFSGGFSLINEPRGDVGCPSARGWIKSRGLIMFQSHGGPRTIVGGELQPIDDRLFSAYFKPNWRNVLNYGAMALDSNNRRIWLFNADGNHYSLDLINNIWSQVAMPAAHLPIGGGVEIGDDFYICTLYSPVNNFGELWVRSRSNTKYDFLDPEGAAILFDVKLQHDSLGDVGVKKEFQRVIVWSVDNPLYYQFLLSIFSYRNFSTTEESSGYVDFNSQLTLDAEFPLVFNAAKALALRFSNNTRYECPHISGYEVEVALPFKKEHLSLKDA